MSGTGPQDKKRALNASSRDPVGSKPTPQGAKDPTQERKRREKAKRQRKEIPSPLSLPEVTPQREDPKPPDTATAPVEVPYPLVNACHQRFRTETRFGPGGTGEGGE